MPPLTSVSPECRESKCEVSGLPSRQKKGRASRRRTRRARRARATRSHGVSGPSRRARSHPTRFSAAWEPAWYPRTGSGGR
eukprot:7385567-Prymnesium_polylepis.1